MEIVKFVSVLSQNIFTFGFFLVSNELNEMKECGLIQN